MARLGAFVFLCTVALAYSQSCNFELDSIYHDQLIRTPNYPNSYPNHLECSWLLRAPGNQQVKILFNDWETELDYDYIEVRDGSTRNATLLDTVQGEQGRSRKRFISSTGILLITFTSDRSIGARGFKATYRTAVPMQFNITTVIHSSLADTLVSSRVTNLDNITREIKFEYLLPRSAAVTSFEMTTRGVTYRGILEIKREAFVKYEEAFIQAITTPYISGLKLSMKLFDTALFVLAGKDVTFKLRYQEIVREAQSRFVYRAAVLREQLFSDIRVDFHVCGRAHIDLVRLPPIESSSSGLPHAGNNSLELPRGFNVTKNGKFVHAAYRPPSARETAPFGGQFEIQFNYTEPIKRAGVFYINNGYFMHNLAPKLPEIRRRIVFVLDISGSMAGVKMEQVRTAVKNFIEAIDEKVLLNIVLFESVIRVWKPRAGLVPASPRNKRLALEFMNSLEPDGASNINGALMTGLRLLKQDASMANRPPRNFIHSTTDLLIFLTDGKPTIGRTVPSAILRNVARQNSRGYGIITIGFGQNVDVDFLRKLAHNNGGEWRQIYEDASAGRQIQNFLATIGAPLLTDVTIKYPPGQVERSTLLDHNVLRLGEEVIVSGILPKNSTLTDGDEITITVTGHSEAKNRMVHYDLVVRNATVCSQLDGVRESANVGERIYGLLRIMELKDLLEAATTEEERRKYRAESIVLSMKYGFVTNVTALIIRSSDAIPTRPSVTVTEQSILITRALRDSTDQRNLDVGPVARTSADTKEPLPWIFQGDPHFIIALHQHMRVCFTWGGKPGKIYNLLGDPDNQIRVNGLVVGAPPRPATEILKVPCMAHEERTYFSQLSFRFGNAKVAFLVTPHKVTVLNATDEKRVKETTFDASDEAVTLQDELTQMKVFNISRMHSVVNVTLRGIATFTVSLHRTQDRRLLHHPKPMSDHVDMIVDVVKHLSPKSSGIFGEFLSRKMQRQGKRAHVVDKDKKHFLKYRQRQVEVERIDMTDPVTPKGVLGCYYVCNSTDFLRRNADFFRVPQLLDAITPENAR